VVVVAPAAVVVVAAAPGAVDEVDALVAVARAEPVVVVEAAMVDDVVPAPRTELEVEDPLGPATLPPSMTPVSRSPM
jgi:hypothetical protein